MNQTKITNCPNCGVEIDVNDLLYQKLEKQARQKYQQQLSDEQKKLQQQQIEITAQQEQLSETVKQQVSESLLHEKIILKQQVEKDQLERIKAMQSELDDKSKKVVALNKAQSEIERLKREQQSMRSEIELEIEKKIHSSIASTK